MYALITGASGGIGKEIAIALAKRKFNVLLVARSEKPLAELAQQLAYTCNIKAAYKVADLTTPTACDDLLQWITENKYDVSVLVNNAGYGLWGSFEKLDLNGQLNMLELNNTALVKLTYKMLPVLKQQPKSYIINVASTASYQAIAYLGIYAASKAFVVSFSRALRLEVKAQGISVSCLSPGGTDTGFMERANMNSKKLVSAAKRVAMTPQAVAEIGVTGMLNGKAEIIPGLVNKLGYLLAKFLPKAITEGVAANLYKAE